MNRKEFLKNTALGLLGMSLFPKELISSQKDAINKPVNLIDTNTEIPQDLIKFAKEFSEKYKELSCGTYISGCGEYRLDYLHRIKDKYSKELISTPYRVGNTTGVMEFSKSKITNMPSSYVFCGVIWCQLMKEQPHDYIMADIKSIQCSLENGYSKKELVKQYFRVLGGSPTDLNRKRMDKIFKTK